MIIRNRAVFRLLVFSSKWRKADDVRRLGGKIVRFFACSLFQRSGEKRTMCVGLGAKSCGFSPARFFSEVAKSGRCAVACVGVHEAPDGVQRIKKGACTQVAFARLEEPAGTFATYLT
jgi:hypothetical protein